MLRKGKQVQARVTRRSVLSQTFQSLYKSHSRSNTRCLSRTLCLSHMCT